jgi:hypothetical protein
VPRRRYSQVSLGEKSSNAGINILWFLIGFVIAAHRVASSFGSAAGSSNGAGQPHAIVHDVQLAFAHSTQTVFYIMAGHGGDIHRHRAVDAPRAGRGGGGREARDHHGSGGLRGQLTRDGRSGLRFRRGGAGQPGALQALPARSERPAMSGD